MYLEASLYLDLVKESELCIPDGPASKGALQVGRCEKRRVHIHPVHHHLVQILTSLNIQALLDQPGQDPWGVLESSGYCQHEGSPLSCAMYEAYLIETIYILPVHNVSKALSIAVVHVQGFHPSWFHQCLSHVTGNL